MKKLFALLLALVMVGSFTLTAFAETADPAWIDATRTGSISLYKYDLSSAEKDGVWDSSYVSKLFTWGLPFLSNILLSTPIKEALMSAAD